MQTERRSTMMSGGAGSGSGHGSYVGGISIPLSGSVSGSILLPGFAFANACNYQNG